MFPAVLAHWIETHRCVGVEVAAHVFYLELQLLLGALLGALSTELACCRAVYPTTIGSYLEGQVL
jgi:hypothetical protein